MRRNAALRPSLPGRPTTALLPRRQAERVLIQLQPRRRPLRASAVVLRSVGPRAAARVEPNLSRQVFGTKLLQLSAICSQLSQGTQAFAACLVSLLLYGICKRVLKAPLAALRWFFC